MISHDVGKYFALIIRGCRVVSNFGLAYYLSDTGKLNLAFVRSYCIVHGGTLSFSHIALTLVYFCTSKALKFAKISNISSKSQQ